jgi:hypothetical protein
VSEEYRHRASLLEGLMRSEAWFEVIGYLEARRGGLLRAMTNPTASDQERAWAAAEWAAVTDAMTWPEREALFCRRQLDREGVNA